MNSADVGTVLDAIAGFWNRIPDVKLEAYSGWLERLDVPVEDVLEAVRTLAGTSERQPTVKAIMDTLRGIGVVDRQVGVGDPRVVGSLATAIRERALEVCGRTGVDYLTRIKAEQAEAITWRDESVAYDLGDAAWHRDHLAAYEKLIRDEFRESA